MAIKIQTKQRTRGPQSVMVSLSKNILGDVKADCLRIATTLSDDIVVQKWINTVFRNWVVNEGPTVPVKTLEADAPAWAQKALESSDLYKIRWAECENILRPVVDYFRNLTQTGERFAVMTVPEAIKQSEQWHADLAAGVGKDRGTVEDGIETLKSFPDGYSWVKVFGKKSLDREGELMGHCVGSYFEEVSADNVTIYSLRDPKNGPHITIEIKDRQVNQIKGKANAVVIAKYRPYLLPFLGTLTLTSIDLDKAGLTTKEAEKYYQANGLYTDPVATQTLTFKDITLYVYVCDQKESSIKAKLSKIPQFKHDLEEYAPHGFIFTDAALKKCIWSKPIHVARSKRMTLGEVIAELGLSGLSVSEKLELLKAPIFKPNGRSTLTACFDADIISSVTTVIDSKGQLELRAFKPKFKKMSKTLLDVDASKFIFHAANAELRPLLALTQDLITNYDDEDADAEYDLEVEVYDDADEILNELSRAELVGLHALVTTMMGDNFTTYWMNQIGKQFEKDYNSVVEALKNGTDPLIEDRPRGISYAELGKPAYKLLARAFSVFAPDSVSITPSGALIKNMASQRYINQLGRAAVTVSELRSKGFPTTVGKPLHEYVEGFFILLLVEDKAKLVKFLTSSPAYRKVLEAFTCSPALMTVGDWGALSIPSASGHQFQETVRKHMHLLLPLTAQDKAAILGSSKFTPAFKGFINHEYSNPKV